MLRVDDVDLVWRCEVPMIRVSYRGRKCQGFHDLVSVLARELEICSHGDAQINIVDRDAHTHIYPGSETLMMGKVLAPALLLYYMI